MIQQLKQWEEKIDGLSVRERGLIFLGLLFVLYSIWDAVLIAPLDNEQKTINAALNSKGAERFVLVQKIQGLSQPQVDPNEENREKLKSLRSRLVNVQADLESSTTNLVSPQDMPKILETVLHKTAGLSLDGLNSTGAAPLIAKEESLPATESVSETETKITPKNIDNAYRHGFRIQFTGDYFSTVSYLKSLEELEWGFYWENMEYEVSEYPEANVSIEIFTLSLKPEWIGV
ncbi:MAG: hypothetical protein AAF419_03330 [Pseudomonadota bacterium]